ncbi:MAG: hypothetical protein GYB68_14985 [Chloroflexi bacterium]|nr:hypothetical protein [Chloroflexota bacterium]
MSTTSPHWLPPADPPQIDNSPLTTTIRMAILIGFTIALISAPIMIIWGIDLVADTVGSVETIQQAINVLF